MTKVKLLQTETKATEPSGRIVFHNKGRGTNSISQDSGEFYGKLFHVLHSLTLRRDRFIKDQILSELVYLFFYFISSALKNTEKKNTEDMQTLVIRT